MKKGYWLLTVHSEDGPGIVNRAINTHPAAWLISMLEKGVKVTITNTIEITENQYKALKGKGI